MVSFSTCFHIVFLALATATHHCWRETTVPLGVSQIIVANKSNPDPNKWTNSCQTCTKFAWCPRFPRYLQASGWISAPVLRSLEFIQVSRPANEMEFTVPVELLQKRVTNGSKMFEALKGCKTKVMQCVMQVYFIFLCTDLLWFVQDWK